MLGLLGIPTLIETVTAAFAAYMRSYTSPRSSPQLILSDGQEDRESCDPQSVNVDESGSDGGHGNSQSE